MEKNYFLLKNNYYLLLLLISSFSFGQTSPFTFINDGTYTFIPPAGITSVGVQAWGAGGAGGGAFFSLGGGGGGGAYTISSSTSVDASSSYNIVVGRGGAGSGVNGGSSSAFGVSANGGSGGKGGGFLGAGAGGIGGIGGTYKGGDGVSGSNGGSSAGTTMNGNNTGIAPTGGGNGGSGGNTGSDGSNPGGGGGGSFAFGSGGSGGDGKLIISYGSCPVYTITSIVGNSPTCGTSNTITVTGLPAGIYSVVYSTTNPNRTGLRADMTVLASGIGTFSVTGFTVNGNSTVTVTSLSSGSSNYFTSGTYFCTTNLSATTPNFIVNSISPAPTGTTSQSFCSGATVASLSATGTAIKWYTTPSGGLELPSTTVLINGAHYYASQTISGGCESTSRLDVTVTVNSLPVVSAGVDRCVTNPNFTLTASPSGGVWSQISGNQMFNLNSTTGAVIGFGNNNTAVFRYTVTNSCGVVADDVAVSRGTVGTPTAITVSTGAEPTCQLTNATTTTTYGTTAANSTSFNWSLSNSSAGTINATTGVMTWANGFSGSVNIQVTANGCGGSSSQRTRTVTVSPTSVAGTVSSNQSICYNSTPSNITLTGSVGTIQWQSSTDNSTFNDISGQTSSTLYNWAIGSLTSTRYYRAVVKSGGCSSVTSAVVTVTVSPTTVVGSVSANQSICTGSAPADITLTGSTGTIQWQSSTDNNTFNDISGATASTLSSLTMGTLTSARYYRAVVKSGTCSSVNSGVVTVTVSPTSVAGTVSVNQSICSGSSPADITLTGSVGTIQWQSSTDNSTFNDVTSNGTGSILYSWVIGSLTSTRYYRAVVKSGGCSVVYSNSIRVTVYGAMPAIGAISLNGVTYPKNGNTSYCANTTATFSIDPVANASSYTWVIPTGWVYVSGQGTTTLIVTTGNTSQSENIQVYATNLGCPQANQSYLYLYLGNPLPSAPTIGPITQPTCAVPTGSFTITNYNASYTYTFSPSAGISNIGDKVTAAPGAYTITASNGSCASTASANIIIDPVITNTWSVNAGIGSWTNGTPTNLQAIVFTGNYSSSSNIDACSCQVTNGAKVVINFDHTLTVTNSVTVDNGSNSTLTFENNASLVQVNDVKNEGSINYKRITPKVNRYDFTYWSSPVEGQTMVALSPNTLYDKYYSYNNGWVMNKYGGLVMSPGNGYIIRAPQTNAISGNPLPFNAEFKGVPNNGKIEKTVTVANLDYLLGNPYPSALYADQFLLDNKDVLDGTLYFWTHNSPPSDAILGDYKYNYTASDYASYNLTGGVGTGKGEAAETEIDKNNKPTGKIAAAQGFFAKTKTNISVGSKVVFNNNMRVSGNNTQFFKLNNTSKITTTTIEKNRLWLNLTNDQGAFKQTLVGYITGATNDYEGSFDGVTYDGNAFVDFYSVNQGTNLAIQGRALPFTKKDSVVLGYRSKIKGEFQISIDATDGVLASQNVFVEDQDLKVLHDLKKEPYTFSTEIGTFNNRFVLRYVDKNVVEVIPEPEVPEVLYKDVLVSVQNAQVKVNSPVELIDKVILYDMAGRKIYQKNKVIANELVITHLLSSNQVLLVDILLSNGTKLTRKIVY